MFYIDFISRFVLQIWYFSHEQGIGPSHRPLPDNTQTEEMDIHAPEGFQPTFPASGRPQTLSLDLSATEIGRGEIYYSKSDWSCVD
jgi:hypothetical protein